MSEYSESYHLRTQTTSDAIELLQRSGLRGFVFPACDGWTSFVAENGKFETDPMIVNANHGLLLHYVAAEDHGWSFSLFSDSNVICKFTCVWDGTSYTDRSGFEPSAVHFPDLSIDARELEYIASMDLYKNVGNIGNYPPHMFATLLRLPHYEWFSYDYVLSDFEDGDTERPGCIEVV